MIAGHGEVVGDARKKMARVMCDWANFSMHDAFGMGNFCPKVNSNQLMAETDP